MNLRHTAASACLILGFMAVSSRAQASAGAAPAGTAGSAVPAGHTVIDIAGHKVPVVAGGLHQRLRLRQRQRLRLRLAPLRQRQRSGSPISACGKATKP